MTDPYRPKNLEPVHEFQMLSSARLEVLLPGKQRTVAGMRQIAVFDRVYLAMLADRLIS